MSHKARPMDSGNSLGGRSLQRTLASAFCLVALLSCTVVGSLTYYLRAQGIREDMFSRLETLRDDRIKEINQWLNERTGDLQIWMSDAQIIDICNKHGQGQDAGTSENRSLLEKLRAAYGYDAAFIVDPDDGQTILSSDPKGARTHTLDAQYRNLVVGNQQLVVSDVFIDKVHDRPEILVAGPVILPETDRLIGILVLECDPSFRFYPHVLLGNLVGETTEVLLVNREGLAQSPLKFYENAVNNLTIEAEPARRAAMGQKGRIAIEDYRSVPVMAAYGHIHGTGWGLVAKQDMAEINAPVRAMAGTVALASIGALIAAIVAGLVTAGRIARPVSAIAAVAEQIGGGDMNARARETGPSEIQRVARNLNLMVEQLATQVRMGKAMNDVYVAASAHNRMADLLRETIPLIAEATRSQIAVVYLGQEDNGELKCVFAHGIGQDRVAQKLQIAPADHLLAQAASSGQVMVSSELPDDYELVIGTQVGDIRARSLLSIPLMQMGRAIGVLGLASLHDYGEEARGIAETLSLNFAPSLIACLASEKTEQMSEEVRATNEELMVVNQRLQAQSEELQKQTEELEAQRLAVEEADRLKSEFLSNMSHELRTPLNSVMALSQLMISQGPDKIPAENIEHLRIIERNGRHLLGLINDILDLSKIESGRMDVVPSEFHPRLTVQQAVETAQPLAEEKGLDLKIRFGELPSMYSDEDKIRQILINLLSNAVKFTDEGEIEVSATSSNETVTFVVRDTGLGISPADRLRIFDEFRQADGSSTRRHEGTGLGLAICQKLAGLLGGQITVQSEMAQGSTFTLTLPLRCPVFPQTVEALPRAAAKPAPTPSAVSPRRTILVIDDEAEVRDLLRGYLIGSGYRVIEAVNGREGLELARQHQPDAITLDVLMPDMDGWEVIRDLKASEETAGIPVIVVSVSDDRSTGMALGAAAYLVKPIDKRRLLAEIERVSGTHEVRRILVVDDDAATRQQLKPMLEERYESVTMAAGGQEALERVRSSLPDVMILDLMMPDLDGFTVLDRLRADPITHDLPVIVLTAKDLTNEERSRLVQAVDQVVTKGAMDTGRLLRELQSALTHIERRWATVPPVREKPLILVVEDNDVAALQIRTALQESGYVVNVATGGAEALESLEEAVPDGVVLDLMMPEIDGFEVMARIRSTGPTARLPILVLTAKELTAEDRARLKYNHIQQLIQKGEVDRDQLVASVAKLVGCSPPAEPLACASDDPAPIMPPASRRRPTSKTLLVVEDNPDNMKTITAILRDMDSKYITAEDGRQAIAAAKESRPGLILMDIQLPGVSGLDAARQIKADPDLANIPIIALTAKAMRGDREAILAAGCDDYLSKPLDPVDVADMVRKWMG